MNKFDNFIDEIYSAIAKYLTDNLIDIKDVKMGDSTVDYQISETKKQIDSETKGQIAKDEIVHWNTMNSIKGTSIKFCTFCSLQKEGAIWK